MPQTSPPSPSRHTDVQARGSLLNTTWSTGRWPRWSARAAGVVLVAAFVGVAAASLYPSKIELSFTKQSGVVTWVMPQSLEWDRGVRPGDTVSRDGDSYLFETSAGLPVAIDANQSPVVARPLQIAATAIGALFLAVALAAAPRAPRPAPPSCPGVHRLQRRSRILARAAETQQFLQSMGATCSRASRSGCRRRFRRPCRTRRVSDRRSIARQPGSGRGRGPVNSGDSRRVRRVACGAPGYVSSRQIPIVSNHGRGPLRVRRPYRSPVPS